MVQGNCIPAMFQKQSLGSYTGMLYFFFNLTVKSTKAVSLQKKVTDTVIFPQALKIT